MTNPYESPTAEASLRLTSPQTTRAAGWFGLLAWSYPVILVAAFYGTWLIAWMVLGHMPRPSLDDPSSISIVVDIPYVIAGLLMVAFPVAAIMGVVSQLATRQRTWLRRFSLAALLVALWVLSIALLRWDPLQVVDWFMD